MTKIFIAGHKGMVGSAIHRQLLDSDVEIIKQIAKTLISQTNYKFLIFLLKIPLIKFIYVLLRLGEFTLIIHIQPILYIRI